MSNGRRRDRDRRPARRTGSKEPRRIVFVVCEGRVTEPEYLRGFERWTNNPGVTLRVDRERGKPKRLVEIATEARGRIDAVGPDDEVWVVFDRDQHERFDEAVGMARDNGIEVAHSNECFELWLLLRFREPPGPRSREELKTLLREHVADGGKSVDFKNFEAGYADALRRARRMAELAEKDGEPLRNPSTTVFRLTESLARRRAAEPD